MARRREKQETGCQLEPRQRVFLLTGADWGFLGPDLGSYGGFVDERAARAAWEACRDELIDYWIQDPRFWPGPASFRNPEPAGAGHRPAGFWLFDAKVPRRVLEKDPAKRNELRALGWFREPAWRSNFGDPVGGYLPVESESAYLSRHRLELPPERDREPAGPRPVE